MKPEHFKNTSPSGFYICEECNHFYQTTNDKNGFDYTCLKHKFEIDCKPNTCFCDDWKELEAD